MQGRFRAKFAPIDYWDNDPKRRGFIPILHRDNVSWARPVYDLGSFKIPTREFVEKNSDTVAVIVEMLDGPDSGLLAWSGFSFWEGKGPEDVRSDDYPYVSTIYYDEEWKIVKSSKPSENGFRIEHSDGSNFDISRKSGEEYIKLGDRVHGNDVIMDKSGIVLSDTNGNTVKLDSSGISIIDRNGNSFEFSPTGIVMSDKFGHTYKMAVSGSTLDGENIVLNPFVQWVLQSSANWGMGNFGAPVPIFPSTLVGLNTGIVPGRNFLSNKFGS